MRAERFPDASEERRQGEERRQQPLLRPQEGPKTRQTDASFYLTNR